MCRRLVTALGAAVLLLAGCDVPDPVGEPDPADVTGSWQLVEGTGPGGPVPLVDDHPITLTFEDDAQVGGTAACNTYGGTVERDGAALRITELVATEMACPPPEVMGSEQAYLTALDRVEALRVDGEQLVLTGDDVELVFEPLPEPADEPLVGTTWVLDALLDDEAASSVPDTARPVTLELAEAGTYEAFTGCNTVNGELVERSGRLDLSAVATTDAACPTPELERLEGHVLAVLDSEVDWELDGDRLTLTAPDGRGLGYRAAH